jgi:hypothetical protein
MMTSSGPASSRATCRHAPQGHVSAPSVRGDDKTRILGRPAPVETVLNSATRSEHIDNPSDTFSINVPRTMEPLSVTTAAPILKPEYGAYADSLASWAARIASCTTSSLRFIWVPTFYIFAILALRAGATSSPPYDRRLRRFCEPIPGRLERMCAGNPACFHPPFSPPSLACYVPSRQKLRADSLPLRS